MIVYRLCKAAYKNDLSGRGAEKAGGRWNSKGTLMLYTGSSRALCTAEIAVHAPLGIVPEDYFLVTIEIDDHPPVGAIDIHDLPSDWKSFPPLSKTQKIGDNFAREGKFLVQVPAAVVQGDFNYLVNPLHPMFKQVRIQHIEPFGFDER